MLTSDLVRRVLDSAPDAMIIIDSAGAIVFANRQVETFFGYEAAALVGEKVELLLPERFRTRHVGHRDGYADKKQVRPMGSGLELFARRRDGSEFPVGDQSQPGGGWRRDGGRRGDPRYHGPTRDPGGAQTGARGSRSRQSGEKAAFSQRRATICDNRCRRCLY